MSFSANNSDSLLALWEKHRAGALQRVSLIERAVNELQTGGLDEQLRDEAQQAAHSLIGSVGTFGFIGASQAARELEGELANPPVERAPTMLRLAEGVRRELEGELSDNIRLPSPVKSDPADGRLQILIVDDDAALCERIAAEAGSRGIRCEVASSPDQARTLCAQDPPAIVLLDLTFAPDGMDDAYTLLSELTAAMPPVPVLVLTGTGTFTDRVEAARRGSRAFLPKSLAAAQVLDAMEQFLARDRLATTRVLVVDDDHAVLDVMRALLEARGLEVSTLADPLRFWETLEEVAPELLILDVDMPGVNGPELCRT
ncbi:MAG: response regulator, partial [Solirubrobacteraceae bacterium]